MKHKHRILPGHMGGKYIPENTVKVEVSRCSKNTATHPMWHYANWLLWGREEDRIAWKGLAGHLGTEELLLEACSRGGKKASKINLLPKCRENGGRGGKKSGSESGRKNGANNGRKNSKPVLCVETSQKYPSASEASRATGVPRDSISASCRKGCRGGGFHWQLIQKED